MSAIERGDWQEVDECQIKRDQSGKIDEGNNAKAHLFAREFGDLERAAKFINRSIAYDDLLNAGDHHAHQIPALPDSERNRLKQADLFKLIGPARRGNANLANRALIAETVGFHHPRGGERNGDFLACPLNRKHHALARMQGNGGAQLAEISNRAAINRNHRIAHLKPRSFCHAGFCKAADGARIFIAGDGRFAQNGEKRGKDRNRHQQVGDRPGRHDQRAFP